MRDIIIDTVNSYVEGVMDGRLLPLLVLALIILVFIVLVFWRPIRRRWSELRLRRAIKQLGKTVLHDISVPDGMDGNIHVEYLVLTPASILMLSVNRFKGVIFAGDNIDLWTQVLDNRSFKFDNPLIMLEEGVASMRTLVPGIEIKGYMVFTDDSEFPKGKPERVLLLSDLKKMACNKNDQIAEKIQQAWDKLAHQVS